MSYVRAQIIIFTGLVLLFTVACGNGNAGKKVKINKKHNPGQESDWFKGNDIVITDSSTGNTAGKPGVTPTSGTGARCLNLKRVSDIVFQSTQNQDGLISVHAFNLDFVSFDNVNKRWTFTSVGDTDALRAQKANYFFKINKDLDLINLALPKELKNLEVIDKTLLVNSQEGCSKVILTVGGSLQSYRILNSDTRRLVLQNEANSNILRTYQLDGRRQLRVGVYELRRIPTCGAETTSDARLVAQEYVVSRADDLERLSLSKNLAGLFKKFVIATNELDENQNRTTNRGKKYSFNDNRLQISGVTYGHIAQIIKSDRAAANVCSSPTPAK